MNAAGGAYLVLLLLAIALAIVWILMPLAVVGIKPLLRRILAQQQRTNELLDRMLTEQAKRKAD